AGPGENAVYLRRAVYRCRCSGEQLSVVGNDAGQRSQARRVPGLRRANGESASSQARQCAGRRTGRADEGCSRLISFPVYWSPCSLPTQFDRAAGSFHGEAAILGRLFLDREKGGYGNNTLF